MRTTIRMVAEHAGVSRGTVDRVLNKRGNVKPEVEERVINSMQALNYQPNTAARALAFNRNIKKIGFLIPSKTGFFRDEVTRGIEKGREESEYLGLEILVQECDANTPNEYIKSIDEMFENGVCGLAISAQNTVSLVEKINELEESGIPVITVNSDIPESKRRCYVGENALKSGRIAAQIIYKYKKAGERILIVAGIPEFEAHVSRTRGFRDYMSEQRIGEECYELIYTYENYELTYNKVFEILTTHKDIHHIYMATNSVTACVEALKRAGMGQEIFMVTHDIPPETIGYLKEGIIDFTIDQDMYKQGYKPIKLLREHFLLGTPIEDTEGESIYHIISSECV